MTKSGGHEAIECWVGTRLYFNKASKPGAGDLWSMAVAGGDERLELQPGREPARIGEIKGDLWTSGRSFAASSDEKTIFWPQAVRVEADLRMIENFR